MKKANKFLSIFLALIMIMSIIPMSVFTASAETVSGTCGENLTWTFDEFTGTLTISGTGAMYDYSYNNRPLKSYEDDIKTVVINDGLTTIGDYAFDECVNLTSVTIPDGVTTIGNCSFSSCNSLTSVTIPDSVTVIGGNAFSWCSNLTSITIPDSVTTIGAGAFSQCSNLTSVTIPNSVTTIGYMAFAWCYSLTSITVDSNNQYYSSDEYGVLFNKDKTTLIQYPIGNTRTSYTISYSVTAIGDWALCCGYNLTSITIPDSVTIIGDGAFYGCGSLTSIIIPDSVTTIGDSAFKFCTSLTSVTIPDSVTAIADYAFYECTNLAYVYYSGALEEWNAIKMGSSNDPLLNATIHFNSPGMPLISVSNIEAEPGETVDVTIDISNNPGVTSVLLKVGFDDTALTLTNVKDGGILGATYHSNSLKNPYTLSWSNDTSTTNFTTNGTLVTLTFEVSENVADGTTLPITVSYSYDDYEIIDKDLNSIYFSISNGEINVVKCAHINVTNVEETPSTCVVQGNSAYTVCNDCGEIISGSDAKLPLGNHSYDAVVTAPTCMVSGYTTHKCIHCGDSYTSDETPAIRHSYVKNICKYCGKVLPEDASVIVVDSKLGITGKEIKVAISLENNPGITSMLLNVNYDTTKLQLVSVDDCGNLGTSVHSDILGNPYTLSWANDTSTTNYTYNGEIVVLTFNVLEDAELGETSITVTYDYDNYDIIDKDMEPVEFETVEGIINIINVIIGDVNEDGKVNTLDRVILTRYIAKWSEYPEGSINTIAADVNGDGKVNTLDRVILTRYIAKWEGYEALPYNG